MTITSSTGKILTNGQYKPPVFVGGNGVFITEDSKQILELQKQGKCTTASAQFVITTKSSSGGASMGETITGNFDFSQISSEQKPSFVVNPDPRPATRGTIIRTFQFVNTFQSFI